MLFRSNTLSVPIHSSVNGVVREINHSIITIEKTNTATCEYLPLPVNTPLEMIKDAGIVGLGGAGFPTYSKLSTSIEDGTVIVNAAECEPILTHNMTRLSQNAMEIVEGLQLTMKIVNASNGIIAIKEIHHNEIKTLQSLIKNTNITIHQLPNLYPMGEERAIIREATERGRGGRKEE